jgi:predicted MFS family arabinose efflux permease
VTENPQVSDEAGGGDAEARPSTGEGADRGAADHEPDTWLYGWALGYAAVGAASLLVPLYAIDLGAGAFVVSLIAATAALAGVPGAIIWGRLVTELAPASVRAEALGAYTAAGSLGGGIGSVVGGGIADGVGYLPAFVVAGGAVALAAYLAVDGVRRVTAA